ncbi:MAG: hypothetical protein H6Q17_1535 [Bacteroidetes bacterium]|nr:hypothetical protein [Bacteroidota bacterium]
MIIFRSHSALNLFFGSVSCLSFLLLTHLTSPDLWSPLFQWRVKAERVDIWEEFGRKIRRYYSLQCYRPPWKEPTFNDQKELIEGHNQNKFHTKRDCLKISILRQSLFVCSKKRLFFYFRSNQFIAFTVDIDNSYFRIFFQKFTQLGNIHIHATGIEVVIVDPNST